MKQLLRIEKLTKTWKIGVFLLILLSFSTIQTAQGQGLKLTFLDAQTKEPLIGTNVYTDDLNFSVVSDANGIVYIKGVSLDDYLNFSYVNYRKERRILKEVLDSGSDTILMEELIIGMTQIDIQSRTIGGERRENIANKVTVLDAKEIALLNPQNSADMLQSNGVFVQKSQMGGGSPIIRGFEANKLLLVIDGVRLNNAIYRNGHLQNVITIDNAVLDRTEIVQGPASVIYGSDALGGVIHFITKEPRLALKKGENEIFEGSAYIRYSTANNEKTGHLDFGYGTKKLGLLSSVSFSSFGDLKAGSNGMDDYPEFGKRYFYVTQNSLGEDVSVVNPNPLVQIGTGYWQVDLLQKIKYQYSKELSIVLNVQYSTTSNVPRYDQLNLLTSGEIPKFARWDYGPQGRFFASAKARYVPEDVKYYDEATIILSTQKVDEDRIQRSFEEETEEHQEEDVTVGALNADFAKIFNESKKQALLYGTEVVYNKVKSTAYRQLPNNIIDPRLPTRYPNGGSFMFTSALYANYRQNFGEKVSFMAGSRYTHAILESKFIPDSLINIPFTEIKANNGALTGSVSVSYEFLKDFTLDVVTSTAFRSPNVDDFGTVRSKNGYTTVPNDSLGPEQSLNFEVSLTKKITDSGGRTKLLVSGTAYRTNLYDAIVRDYFTLGNTNLIYVNGSYDTIQANVNGGRAYIEGASFSLQWNILNNFQLKSNFNWVKGFNITQNEPLAHIPPIHGQLSLTYETNELELTFISRFNGWKRVEDYAIGSSDNLEYATEDGTPSWMTQNIYAKYKISEKLSVNVACENITDVLYRTFSSGVSAPGRNFIFTLRSTF